jgi:membrane-bound ClpP family serine protease
MIQWWNSLDTFARIYAFIAIPSTLVLVVQTILLMIGMNDGDDGLDLTDNGIADTPGDGGSDGLALFSIRGIMALLTVGGWSGLALYASGVNRPLTILISAACGTAALFAIAYLMRAVMKLQSSGNISLSHAIGKTGRVYIPIPPHTQGSGKITLTLQERFLEADAVTTAERKLVTGEAVRVVATDDSGLLVVEPVVK